MDQQQNQTRQRLHTSRLRLARLIRRITLRRAKELIALNFARRYEKILAQAMKDLDTAGTLNIPDVERLMREVVETLTGVFSAEGMIASSDEEESVYKTNKIKEILKNLVVDLKFSEPFPTKAIYLFNYSNTVPGVPSEEALPSLYWRKKKTIPKKIDPWRDRCGLIWIGSVSPLLGKTMIKVVAKVKKIFADYGFEPNIAFNLATERAAYINIMIIYDKEVQGEDQRALKCYKTTISALKKYGIMPYRLTTKGMSFIHPDVNYSELIKSLKKLVDPNNILMPGRYDFS